MSETPKALRIVRLEADNFKRLRAVSITPKGGVVEITGKNGAGKTSVLDAIWAALGGKDAAPPVPVRKGEEVATITLDLGTLRVVRKFKAQEDGGYTTSLVVESAEGARFPSPQGVLDALVGELSFDPLAFTRMPAKDQFTALRRFVPDVDFDRITGLNKRDFEQRTEINRRAKELRAQAAALPVAEGDVPEPVDLEALEATLSEAAEHNGLVERRRLGRETAHARVTAISEEIERLVNEQEELVAKLREAEAIPDLIDTDKVRADLASGRQANALVERLGQRTALETRASEAEAEAVTLTQAIETRNAEAAKAVASAKMPVNGLSFGDGLVMLNGVPFEQASDAEQLRASIAIAGAMNPRLRVVRVRDGSLLDGDAWKALTEFAEANDLQIWAETVQSGRPHAVLIEDGGVAGEASEAAPLGADDEVL